MTHPHSTLARRDFTLQTVRGRVTHVADGDTLTIDTRFWWFHPKERITIRLNGMDTPERSTQEPFAEEAAAYTTRRVMGKTVSMTMARRSGSKTFVTGSFGRVIGIVYPRWWSKSLNEELLERGLARLYDKPCAWMTKGFWRACERAWKKGRRTGRGIHQMERRGWSWGPGLLWFGIVCGILGIVWVLI